MHGGIREMLQYLRRDLWIVHARVRCLHQCKTCKLHQRAMQQQQMADLPRSRVMVAPPFSNAGLDYAGPFLVRHGGKRSTTTTKTYAAIFICMCTKAVHIELAEDLSTRAFLDVFDRFVSRRGYCTNLYSDNGTQFVGANRQLQTDLVDWHNTYSKQQLSVAGDRWHFITPSAPHQGGLWEAAVRSAKKHLKRVIGDAVLPFIQLSTLLVRIEACLNSRPIIALHDDPESGVALSPGDFLIGRPLNSRPEATVPEAPDNRLKYYQRLQRMLQHFWHRWKEEYLVQLQARSKWARPTPNLQVGDVVAIQQEQLPPSRWRIGRINSSASGE
ncbi:PREDICTED: uncharacterized protein LOC108369976 isoform X2 [Rhagoletis zephyria]|uniref:uncharacterized protein LOC108369976 isoform X2 n=1 Tax=Rhagoletis zephyria TaxID=28612 RepID=UPI000811207E|nr:PREDICTED: uncharacterized protein LOC108369976 isoform X2 [Rhagoletis zephyria]